MGIACNGCGAPESWGEAIEIDEMIRSGINGTKERLYLHLLLKPPRYRSAPQQDPPEAWKNAAE